MEPQIAKNIERWRMEQEKKKEKRERTRREAVSLLSTELNRPPKEHEIRTKVGFLLAERRAKWMLKNCRATIGEIVKQHGGIK